MKKNLYFRYVFKGTPGFQSTFSKYILLLLVFPRTLLEVFIRKNLGERYFSMFIAILMLIVLVFIPFVFAWQFSAILFFIRHGFSTFQETLNMLIYGGQIDWANDNYQYFILTNASWYLFLIAFFYQCTQRRKEIKRLPSVFDFGRSSYDPGEIHPRFWTMKWKKKPTDIRTIETVLEPLFFAVVGIILLALQQIVGILILFSSFCYWLNYRIAYQIGDDFIMDTIDEMLFSEEKSAAFIEGKNGKDAKGVRYYGRKPADPDTRRKVADMFEEDDTIEVN